MLCSVLSQSSILAALKGVGPFSSLGALLFSLCQLNSSDGNERKPIQENKLMIWTFFFFNQVDESDSFMCSHNCHSELDEGNTYFMSENPKLHYFHSIVSRSSIYLVKYRPCQSNLCHGAFGVCSCRSHLDMVGIRKSFLCPRVRLQTLAFVGYVGKPHPSPLPSVNT